MTTTRRPARHHLPEANALLTDDTGQEMEARYDETTDRWSIALPCGQVATGIRPSSIIYRVMHEGWTVSS